jgi:hypothetical protein
VRGGRTGGVLSCAAGTTGGVLVSEIEIELDATSKPTRAFAPYNLLLLPRETPIKLRRLDANAVERTTRRDRLGNGSLASIHHLQQVFDAGSDFHGRPCTRHRSLGATVPKASESGTDSNRFSGGRQAGRRVRFDYDCDL